MNTTMIYARVHDQTVANDYYKAMDLIEEKLLIPDEPALPSRWTTMNKPTTLTS